MTTFLPFIFLIGYAPRPLIVANGHIKQSLLSPWASIASSMYRSGILNLEQRIEQKRILRLVTVFSLLHQAQKIMMGLDIRETHPFSASKADRRSRDDRLLYFNSSALGADRVVAMAVSHDRIPT